MPPAFSCSCGASPGETHNAFRNQTGSDTLGWKTNPFLLDKIIFKPSIIDQLAKEAGIEPAALDLLRKLGITSVADLTNRLGIADPPPAIQSSSEETLSVGIAGDEESSDNVATGEDFYEVANDLRDRDIQSTPPGAPDPDDGDGAIDGTRRGAQSDADTADSPRGVDQGDGGHGDSAGHAGSGSKGVGTNGVQGERANKQGGGRPFISYVGSHLDANEPDPDGLDHAARMKIEDQAIALIISLEPDLRRTPDGNPGFDLFEADESGQPGRWIEVKSMTGNLENRPVGISRTQFEYARAKGDAYWLYVVEHATDPANARVLRIQNPIAHAQTFTFDHGWRQIARTEPPGVTGVMVTLY